MTNSDPSIQAIGFDYGNTLIEFGPRQMEHQFTRLADALADRFGSCDIERLQAARKKQVMAPYGNGFRENDVREIAADLVRQVYGREAGADDIAALVDVRYQSFIDAVSIDPGDRELLRQLGERYPLALVSNFPCPRSIRDSLDQLRIDDLFSVVVVSGEVGWVKPDRRPFDAMLAGLDRPAESCLFVGDNWLADIQGAKQSGMRTVWTRQYTPYETIVPQPGDVGPDAEIVALDELAGILAKWEAHP